MPTAPVDDAETAAAATDTGPVDQGTDQGRASKGGSILAAQDDFPRVQEHAIAAEMDEAAPASQPASQPASDAPTDYKGRPFDPALHAVDSTGAPIVGDRNRLKMRQQVGSSKGRPVRVKSVVGKPAEAASDAEPAASSPAGVEVDESKLKAAAAVLTGGFFTVAQILGGDDFKPESIDEAGTISERALLESSVADYLRATGSTDIPPGIALAIVAGSIIAKRAPRPAVQARFAKMVGHFRGSKTAPQALASAPDHLDA
jgi:hypothetical protein